jgi:hypothetical protein
MIPTRTSNAKTSARATAQVSSETLRGGAAFGAFRKLIPPQPRGECGKAAALRSNLDNTVALHFGELVVRLVSSGAVLGLVIACTG